MVVVRFKTEKKREQAWKRAGKSHKLADMGGLRNAHWIGKKSLTFPHMKDRKVLKKLIKR